MSENLDLSALLKKHGNHERDQKRNQNQNQNTQKSNNKKNIPKTASAVEKVKKSQINAKSPEKNRKPERNPYSYSNQNSQKEYVQGKEKRKDKAHQPNWNFQGYVGAPYNFIPISEKTYDYDKNQKTQNMHNVLKKELLSGCITYQIQAKTPILIDSGKTEKKEHKKTDSKEQGIGEFYKDANGNFAIPGSSIRGLVRNNAQILSFAEVGDDIDDYYLMYRNVASGVDKKRYEDILGAKPVPIGTEGKSISVLLHVKAGYIAKKGQEYRIYRTKVNPINSTFGEMNYYIASEKAILEDYQKDPEKSKFQYLYTSNLTMQYTKNCEFIEKNRWTGKPEYVEKEKWMFHGRQNGAYHPFYTKISYEIHGERKVEAIGSPGTYSRTGYLLSSGAMNMKKVIYIIPEIDREQEYISIPEQDIDSYKRDFEGKKTQIKGSENYFGLPQDGEEKPVFYIEHGGKLYFGFTPRLRLFYDNNIKAGYRQTATKLDYCKALFGYSRKEESYKSRLSFQDASVKQAQTLKQREVVLGSPKPTSYLDYIESVDKPQENIVTYNNEFRLRGVKQYWLKESVAEESSVKNKNVGSRLKPLSAGTVFYGKVRFHNLTKDELGLLLWSLELNPESEQNIGKAKAYGYGRIKILVDKLEIFDIEKAYDPDILSIQVSDFLRPVCLVQQEKKDEYIRCFKEEMRNWLGKEVEETKSVRSFLLMKDSRKIPEADKTRYMLIDAKEKENKKKNEFQDRVREKYPLPTIEKVIE